MNERDEDNHRRGGSFGLAIAVQDAYNPTPERRIGTRLSTTGRMRCPPGSYAPRNNQEFWNQENFGFSGRDPSRVGGDSPNLNPPS